MQAQAAANHFSGAVLVAQKGVILYNQGLGQADVELNVHNTLNSVFEIASLTKHFTAAAVMLLAEQGKLHLTDKLSRYIPDYPKGDSVTIKMLLSHTSGIKDLTTLPDYPTFSKQSLTPEAVIALFENQPYDFSPGSRFRYSNSGYVLLGYIIEKVSGMTYPDFMDKVLLQKAGLKHTGYNRQDSVWQNRVKGYRRPRAGMINAEYISMDIPYAAGSLLSTTGDLYQWERELMSGKVISPASVQAMTTPNLGKYGYGLYIDTLQNRRHISHSGGIPGFATHIDVFPADDMQVIVLSNNSSNPSAVAEALIDICFGQKVVNPVVPKPGAINLSLLQHYAGNYHTNVPLSFIVKDGKFYRHRDGAPDVELVPESGGGFFYPDSSGSGYIHIRFNEHGGEVVSSSGVVSPLIRDK